MKKFNISLVNETNVVLNLRALCKKLGYNTGLEISNHIDIKDRKIRRILSGWQDVKIKDLEKFSKLFDCPSYMFLKNHKEFISYINEVYDDTEPIKTEIGPMFEIDEINDYKMTFFGLKSGLVVLSDGSGYFTETIRFKGTEEEAQNLFEELCLRYDNETKIEIGILETKYINIQTYTREKLLVREALIKKVLEIWSAVNPDVASLFDEEPFDIYSEKSERFSRILPNKEYQLLQSLKYEIFPHKIEQENQ